MTTKHEITVDPDTRHVLSATQTEAVLLGSYYPESIEAKNCVLRVSRTVYHAALDAWLDGKAGYASHGAGYAGVGYIVFDAALEDFDAWITNDDGEKITVVVFTADTFTIDMEHG